MTKFKLALILGFVLGWAVRSGRAEELWRRVRSAPDDRIGFDGSMPATAEVGPPMRPDDMTARVASA